MSPLLRRSWALRGQTPVFYQRTRSHKKVSAIAALCIAPDREHLSLYFRLHPDKNINASVVKDFLRILMRQLEGPVVLVWDRLQAHKARTVTALVEDVSFLHCFFLPPYAPELNPVEYLWSYLKTNPLANLPAEEVCVLADAARRHSRSIQRKQHLLRSFLKQSPLPLRLH
jgi:hypothetical protein